MDSISTLTLFITLFLLIGVSAFFSGSETGMMAINHYRLRHQVRKKNKAAKRVEFLLEKPERLLGVILIGNTFSNILAAAIATILAVRLWGELGLAFATTLLTLIVLIFAEVTPKTLAALYPERIAYHASIPLKLLLYVLYPFVWLVNLIVNGFLRLLRIQKPTAGKLLLTQEELRSVVFESSVSLSGPSRAMLLRILDLRDVTVEDVMVPRGDLVYIDLQDDWEHITLLLQNSQYTKLPLCDDGMDNVIGIVHLRQMLQLSSTHTFNKAGLRQIAKEPYYVPEATPLSAQLRNFQRNKQRMALVVNEYGEIQGAVTLENILEEIVGELDITKTPIERDIYPQEDNTFLVDGSANIRELNRTLDWDLPQEGPKTLNGLITEYLEMIPAEGTCMRIGGYSIEVVLVKNNRVKLAKIFPILHD